MQPDTVKRVLEGFDKTQKDNRISELKDVVSRDGRHLVFIRRAESPDLLLHNGAIVHGYRPEWIILDFADGAKRVDISSVSVSVPLEIANRLASGYFGFNCEYENDAQVTHAKQLERLLKELANGNSKDAVLVEIVVSNSPLDGSAKLKIISPDTSSIGDSISHFEKAVGSILNDVDNVDSIKVLFRKKRVSLIFDGQENPGEYVVRYSDHRLNAIERRPFEDFMEQEHGVTIFSTEKRFKQ